MERLKLSGRVVTGQGRGALFTKLAWARTQFVSQLGIDPFPGTLNLKLEDAEILERWKELKKQPGCAVIPPDSNSCRARCYPVLVEDRLEAAIVYPEVPDYPEAEVELIASVSIRESLSLRDGDRLSFAVVPRST